MLVIQLDWEDCFKKFSSLTKIIRCILNGHPAQHIQQALSDRDSVEKQRQERLISNLTQTLERTVTQRLDKAVKDEMRRSVVPGKTY